MKKNQAKLIQSFVNLGLTNQESGIYHFILTHPLTQVRDISSELDILIPGVHRALKNLKEYGLIQTNGKKPLKLRAIDPSISLPQMITHLHQENLAAYQQVKNQLQSTSLPQDELRVEFLEDKAEALDYSINLVKQCRQELLIISVGEPIPRELFATITQKIQKGVTVKMISQEYTGRNNELLTNWQKNGWLVKHLPRPQLDFSLIIYDSRVTMIQVRKEQAKDHRAGIVIHNPGYTKAQKLYFESLWKIAKEI